LFLRKKPSKNAPHMNPTYRPYAKSSSFKLEDKDFTSDKTMVG